MNVTFSNEPVIYAWSEDEDRCSDWVFRATDRLRFQRRIKYMEEILRPVLLSIHRDKVFRRHYESFLVIDMQGLNNDEFIPKEMSISDGKRSMHVLFKPSRPFHQLPPYKQKEIRWLERNYLNINYGDGYVELGSIGKVLNEICKTYEKIYVKGHQKADFLRKYVDLSIVNLEFVDDCVPNFVKTNSACFYHKKSKLSMCTERNVETLLNYLLDK